MATVLIHLARHVGFFGQAVYSIKASQSKIKIHPVKRQVGKRSTVRTLNAEYLYGVGETFDVEPAAVLVIEKCCMASPALYRFGVSGARSQASAARRG